MKRISCLTVTALVILVAAAQAQEPASAPASAPATQPASAPATQPATATTPASAPGDEVIEDVGDIHEVSQSAWNPSSWSTEASFARIERGLDLPLARTLRKHSFILSIDHRANESLASDPGGHVLGLFGGSLKVPLGLRYGILDNLDVGFLRVNKTVEAFDVYELDARYRILAQGKAPLDLALRLGGTLFAQPSSVASAVFGQLLADRTFAGRYTIGLDVLYSSDSSGPDKLRTDTNWSVAVGGLLEARLARFLALDLECVGKVAGYGAKYPQVSAGIKFVTNRHTITLMVTTSAYTSADAIVANTARGLGDMVFGFSLTREFD